MWLVRHQRLAKWLLVAASLVFSLVVIEAAYRLWLAYELHIGAPIAGQRPELSFSAVNATHLLGDPVLGYRYRVGTHEYITAHFVDGLFERCESFVFRADRTEASGIVRGDSAEASLRILVFGDSFTAIQLEGETWPSLLQRELEQGLGMKVHVVNLARFGHGVMQMVDLAALMVQQWRPDAIVVAYITNDLIRPRFQLVEHSLRGRERLLLTLSAQPDPDPRASLDVSDYLQINARITREWCNSMTAAKAAGASDRLRKDAIARDLLAQRQELRADHRRSAFRVDFLTLRASFAWNRVYYGNPYRGVAREEERAGIRAIRINRFEEDATFRRSVDTLLKRGTRIFLVHIPHQFEILDGREFDYARAGGMTEQQGAALRDSLEAALGTRSIALLDFLGPWRTDPAAHIISDTDHHPNRRGMGVLATAVARTLIRNGVASAVRRCQVRTRGTGPATC